MYQASLYCGHLSLFLIYGKLVSMVYPCPFVQKWWVKTTLFPRAIHCISTCLCWLYTSLYTLYYAALLCSMLHNTLLMSLATWLNGCEMPNQLFCKCFQNTWNTNIFTDDPTQQTPPRKLMISFFWINLYSRRQTRGPDKSQYKCATVVVRCDCM